MPKTKIYACLLYLGFFVNDFYPKTPLCISLGSTCGPALNLRSLGIRTVAYPFDWVISPFEALINALNDDFQYFLNDLKIRPGNQGVIDHYGFHFTHDWPTINQSNIDALNSDFIGNNTLFHSWQKVLPAVKEKYRRRIERLNQACLSKEKVVFIRADDISKESAITLRDFFIKKYPNLDFVLVVLRGDIAFQEPWNIDKIRNFYFPQYNDFKLFGKILKQVDPAFPNISCCRSFHSCWYTRCRGRWGPRARLRRVVVPGHC